jgi:hypothetical protein
MHVLEAALIANLMKSPRQALFGYPPADCREIQLLLDAAREAPVPAGAPSRISSLAARLRRWLANGEA